MSELFTMREGRSEGKRLVVVVAVVMLISAAVAYAVTTLITSPSHTPIHSHALSSSHASTKSDTSRSITTVIVSKLTGTHQGYGTGIAFGAGSAWVLGDGGVVRLNEGSGHIQNHVAVKGDTENLAYGAGDLWVVSVVGGTNGFYLSEVSPTLNRVIRVILVDGGSNGVSHVGLTNVPTVAVRPGSVLMAFATGGIAQRAKQIIEGKAPGSYAELATVDASTGVVSSIAPTRAINDYPTARKAFGYDVTIPGVSVLGGQVLQPDSLAVTEDGADVWVPTKRVSSSEYIGYVLNEYSPVNGAMYSISTKNIGLVASGDGQLWGVEQSMTTFEAGAYLPTTVAQNGALVQINPANGRINDEIYLPHLVVGSGENFEIAISGKALWVLEPSKSTVYRITI